MLKLKGKIQNNIGLNEVFQKTKFFMAFAHLDKEEGTVEQLHKFVKCKDFLNDVLVESKSPGKFKFPVYGFNCKDIKIDDELCLLIKTDKKLRDELRKNISILNNLEKNLRWKRSKIDNLSNNQSLIVITGSKMWLLSPLILSIYTTILRSLVHKIPENINSFDSWYEYTGRLFSDHKEIRYIKTMAAYKFNINFFLRNHKKIFKNDYLFGNLNINDDELDSTYHNNIGIISFLEKDINWHRFYKHNLKHINGD